MSADLIRNREREAEQHSRNKGRKYKQQKAEKGTVLELRGEEIKIERKKIRRENKKEEAQKRTKYIFNEHRPNILKGVYRFYIFTP